MKNLSWQTWVVGSLIAAMGANALSAYLLHFPFLYCWFGNAAAGVYFQFGMILLYAAMGMLVICLFIGERLQAILAFVFIVAVIELPTLTDSLFRMGGHCG